MLEILSAWYKRNFSNPDMVTLLLILLTVFFFIYFFSNLLMPVFVAIVIAYLLDWPTTKLEKLGFSRLLATVLTNSIFLSVSLIAIIGLIPIFVQQGSNLLQETPRMISDGQKYLLTLPEKYPDLIDTQQLADLMKVLNQKALEFGQVAIEASLNSIVDIVALMVYLILVPLMIFFFVKDKKLLVDSFLTLLPQKRRLASQVSDEMNQQIFNYLRGKVIEILIIGGVTTISFMLLGLNYSLLLGVLVGLSVLVPYVGATVVTIPVILVALFQFGLSAEFGYVMLAYGIIQALDGNLLVPLLFSEAVNLHPVTIIVAVIFFGGLWGFWGVFFAIPLATLVKAVFNAWNSAKEQQAVCA